MPTHLPERIPALPEPKNGVAWIAGILAVGVLIGLTIRAPAPCGMTLDSGCIDIEAPQHFARIVMARTAPLVVPAR